MANWKKKIKGIKELLTDDNSNEGAIEVSKKVYSILTSKRYAKYFEDFEWIVDFYYCEGLDHFNNTLALLYDYADANLIWIE